jgi:hypothetical protein
VGNAHGPSERRNGSDPEKVPPTHGQALVRVLVHLIFSTKDRANVMRPDVASELIQFLRKPGVESDERHIWR